MKFNSGIPTYTLWGYLTKVNRGNKQLNTKIYGIPTYTLWGYRLEKYKKNKDDGIPTYTLWGYRIEKYKKYKIKVPGFPPTLCGATAYKSYKQEKGEGGEDWT